MFWWPSIQGGSLRKRWQFGDTEETEREGHVEKTSAPTYSKHKHASPRGAGAPWVQNCSLPLSTWTPRSRAAGRCPLALHVHLSMEILPLEQGFPPPASSEMDLSQIEVRRAANQIFSLACKVNTRMAAHIEKPEISYRIWVSGDF